MITWALGDTLLTLDYGVFNGTVENGLSVWRGVPFARPPVGKLRFRAPQPPQMSTSVQQAKEFKDSCLQFGDEGTNSAGITSSEDCLYLNIWKPTDAKNLPILFWIHGGWFIIGSSSLASYDGSHLVRYSNNNIIFVSANYRLGPLGFLASEEVRRGGDLNAGLLDQRMAMDWIRKYARAFGGDPTQLTVMGESAGAFSIGFHLLSEKAFQRPFDRAILASGASTSAYNCPSYKSLQQIYDEFVKRVGCSTAKDTLECLRKCNMTLLHDAGKAMANSSTLFNFIPTVDGKYVKKDCSYILENCKFLAIPLIVGTTTNEGTIFTRNLPSNTWKEFSAYSPNLYKYRFNQARDPLGAFHTADIPYAFHNTRSMTTSQVKLADLISDYYISFVRSGDPNAHTFNFKWPKYGDGQQIVFEALNTRLEMDTSDNERCTFWNSFNFFCFK
ncbi:uncharacterized protein VTP21DRAFT_3347 [Calcarisporiella thermophila]|uniref:uncharacterized protein n=1 Tax=Calcarisporiella thermophila TaxID=911321 RepID=UPI003742DAEE